MNILKTIYKILERTSNVIVMSLILLFVLSFATDSLGINSNNQPFGDMTSRIRATFVSIVGAKVRNSIESENGNWYIDADGVGHFKYIVLEPQDSDVFNTVNPTPDNGTIVFFNTAQTLSFWQDGIKRDSRLTHQDDWTGQITYQFVSFDEGDMYIIKAAQVN